MSIHRLFRERISDVSPQRFRAEFQLLGHRGDHGRQIVGGLGKDLLRGGIPVARRLGDHLGQRGDRRAVASETVDGRYQLLRLPEL